MSAKQSAWETAFSSCHQVRAACARNSKSLCHGHEISMIQPSQLSRSALRWLSKAIYLGQLPDEAHAGHSHLFRCFVIDVATRNSQRPLVADTTSIAKRG